jgi:hypothetical protein
MIRPFNWFVPVEREKRWKNPAENPPLRNVIVSFIIALGEANRRSFVGGSDVTLSNDRFRGRHGL